MKVKRGNNHRRAERRDLFQAKDLGFRLSTGAPAIYANWIDLALPRGSQPRTENARIEEKSAMMTIEGGESDSGVRDQASSEWRKLPSIGNFLVRNF